MVDSAEGLDVTAFECAKLERVGMPADIVLVQRPQHFRRVFASDAYAASHYGYLWSDLLAADAFRAFEDVGDVFDGATARRLRDYIYSAANLRDPAAAYRAFGRMPTLEALLHQRRLEQQILGPAGSSSEDSRAPRATGSKGVDA